MNLTVYGARASDEPLAFLKAVRPAFGMYDVPTVIVCCGDCNVVLDNPTLEA
jgi:hypothetical protein